MSRVFRIGEYPRKNVMQVYEEKDTIYRDPIYQRIGRIWDRRRKQLFIDSIVNGFDLPKIYFHEFVPPRKIEGAVYRYAIIDGKQRLESIWEFLDDDYPLADSFEFFEDPSLGGGGAFYSELVEEFPFLLARFESTELPIVTIQTDDEELVDNLFSRLNEAVPLNAPEYRNTLGGPLPRVFRELGRHRFFTKCVPFPTGRYKYLDLAAKFLFVIHEDGFVSTKKGELDQFVKDFRNDREKKKASANATAVKKLKRETSDLLDQMAAFFVENDALLSNIGWISLYFHMFRLCRPDGLPQRLSREMFEQFVEEVTSTRRIIRELSEGGSRRGVRVNQDLGQFDSLRQSLNDASALRNRHAIVQRYLSRRFRVRLPDQN